MAQSSSPVIPHSSKLNVVDPSTNIPSNPSSPRINHRSSPTPPSTSLFPNPFEEQQHMRSNSPFNEQQDNKGEGRQMKDDVAVGTLLDITADDSNRAPQPTQVPHTQHDLFNLDLNSQSRSSVPVQTSDLLGFDFNAMPAEKPILHRNASETVLPAPILATTALKAETKSSSNQNIDRLDPFKDLFSSTAQRTPSNESLAAKQAAAATTTTTTTKPSSTPLASTTAIPNYNINLTNRTATASPQPQSQPQQPSKTRSMFDVSGHRPSVL